eukprot:g9448.t1
MAELLGRRKPADLSSSLVQPADSEDQLHRLVKEHETVIVSCFPDSKGGESEVELNTSVASTALCRTSLDTARAAGLLLPDGHEGGQDEDTKGRQDVWWLFFRGGEMVYAAYGSSIPGPKLSRLAALLERNPDTLAQLSRQDQVSRSQKRTQKAAAATAAAAAVEERHEDAAQRQKQGSAVGKNETGVGGGGAGGWGGGGGGVTADGPRPPVLIFVAGDRSQVGKSSTCLGLLGSLLRQPGLRSSDLAYIKPATQCEKPQLVTEWCEANGVACRGIGPVVFYKGFTREFLKGGAGTSEDLLQEIRDAVGELSPGKQVVVVDGVGYPAVGSICGVSNADVAAALNAPVLLVGKSGVGDAVDSYNLNACFFEARGVRVLGGVFNRISTTGYYSLELCREAVTSYFAQANPNALPYGFVPEIASLKTVVVSHSTGATATTAPATSAKALTSPAPQDPANAALPGVDGTAEAGKESKEGAGSRGTGAPEAVVANGATNSAVGGAEEAFHAREQMPVTAVESEEDLETFVTAAGSERLVLVDVGAEWCKNCKAILPFVHRLPGRLDGAVAVATADVDEAAELADSRDVSSIPHFIFLRRGVQVDTYTGSSETELLSKLTEHLPSFGSPETSPTPGDYETTGDASSATGRGDNAGKEDKLHGTVSDALGAAEALIEAFDKNVDVARLLRDIRHHATTARRGSRPSAAPPLPPADTGMNVAGLGSIGSAATAAPFRPPRQRMTELTGKR